MAVTADTQAQFKLQRQRIDQDARAQADQENDALNRRFAALGGLNSGAYIKQQQIASDNAMKRRQQAMEGVDAAESQDLARKAEIEQGRQYQTAEREAGQNFSAQQAGLQRNFLTGEREAGQQFTGSQADLQRGFLTSERMAGQGFAADQADKQRSFTTNERLSSQDFAAGQSAEARALERERIKQEADQFAQNYGLAVQDLNKKDILEKILSGDFLPGFGGAAGGAAGLIGKGVGAVAGGISNVLPWNW